MKTTLLFFVCLFLFSLNVFSQTCILIAVRNDTIAFGADSRETVKAQLVQNGIFLRDTVFYKKACKIHSVHKIYFAGSEGFTAQVEPFLNKTLAAKGKNENIKLISDKCITFIQDSLERFRTTDKNRFKNRFSKGRIVCNFLVAWFKGSTPNAQKITIQVLTNENEKVKVGVTINTANLSARNATTTLFIGQYAAIERDLTNAFLFKQPIANAVKFLIEKEANYSIEVGLPVTVLQITPNTTTVPFKGMCTEKY